MEGESYSLAEGRTFVVEVVLCRACLLEEGMTDVAEVKGDP